MNAAPTPAGDGIALHRLPRPAPARVLACGAWLKNTAALLEGDRLHLSPLHGDLGTPQALQALHDSARALLARAGGRVDAVAHDLHPDFASTRLAQALAAELGVPALPVQHHHAHAAAVQAEQGLAGPPGHCVALALDGVGLGSDGTAWGGELLAVAGPRWQRLAHLTPLALPGGDIAAREPWRMAAAALHALGRGDEIVPRLAPAVGARLAQGVAAMLARGLNCPPTTSAGRWFDAVAGLLGLSVRQAQEAQAAVALERAAAAFLLQSPSADGPAEHDTADTLAPTLAQTLDLRPLLAEVLAQPDPDPGAAAARFHLGLAQRLARATVAAAQAQRTRRVVLAGGCFYNRVLSDALTARLQAAGLDVARPQLAGPGDAGIAIGQAWVAAWEMAGAVAGEDRPFGAADDLDGPDDPDDPRPRAARHPEEHPACA
jgi:hydrogenase maturation protein HypF